MSEKTIHDQKQDYLPRIGLFYSYQSGFKANHSTDTCLSRLMHMILNGAENRKHTGIILINFCKTFDTLDHQILLYFLDKTIKCFRSYLTNRAFLVSFGNVFSEAGTINCGVPQGSILGALLLFLFVNDIPQALLDGHIYLYADGTRIYQDRDVAEIENVLNKESVNLYKWFVDNMLSIHFGEDKT